MNLYLNGLPHVYELQRLAQMFFFGEKVLAQEGATQPEEEYLEVRQEGHKLCARVCLQGRDATAWDEQEPDDDALEQERKLAVLLFDLLKQATGFTPPWGILTGVRPIKFLTHGLAQGASEQQLRRHYVEECLVREDRFALAMQTANIEHPLLARSTPDSVSLYVSIPFCPTRCAYCSFVSHSVERAAKLIPEYVDRLCMELVHTSAIVRRLGLKLRTIYFGGGTPTTLSAPQLERIMQTLADQFDLEQLWEYTIEAGRPDTITPEKLQLIQRMAPDARISLNPQTLSDCVLQTIGRRHTTAQLRDAFALARDCGLKNINMDLIAGLPTDTQESFQASVDGVIAMQPENITVHTLTVKRAAALTFAQARAQVELVGGMVDYARQALATAGFAPYYLYRQTGSLSCLENVGYSKAGFEGLYNIYIMDETHSIFAVGAGASTKLMNPQTKKLERIFNYKYPYEYISRFPVALERKDRILEFYDV